jgi:hypothetical protein
MHKRELDTQAPALPVPEGHTKLPDGHTEGGGLDVTGDGGDARGGGGLDVTGNGGEAIARGGGGLDVTSDGGEAIATGGGGLDVGGGGEAGEGGLQRKGKECK